MKRTIISPKYYKRHLKCDIMTNIHLWAYTWKQNWFRMSNNHFWANTYNPLPKAKESNPKTKILKLWTRKKQVHIPVYHVYVIHLFFGASDFCTFKTMDLTVFLDEFLSLHLFARGKSLQILHLDLVYRFFLTLCNTFFIFFLVTFNVLFDFLSPS